jgi:flagellar motility protein MotE (MotC chaperone)
MFAAPIQSVDVTPKYKAGVMNEQQLIEVLWKFVGWSAAAVVALVSLIYASIRAAISRIAGRVDGCASKEEVEKVERDLKDELRDHRNDRQRRDDQVDRKLDEINTTVTGTHKRIDDLYRAMVNQGGGR